MENKFLSVGMIAAIFTKNNIAKVSNSHKLNTGFTNDIYVVNDKCIRDS